MLVAAEMLAVGVDQPLAALCCSAWVCSNTQPTSRLSAQGQILFWCLMGTFKSQSEHEVDQSKFHLSQRKTARAILAGCLWAMV